MRVVKNEQLIASRNRIARILMPIGLVALIAGFIVSLQIDNPSASLWSWVLLIIGVVTSSIGVNFADKWMSLPNRPRADQSLEGALKALDVRHKLYSWTLPNAEQVLLSPNGLTVFLVKKQEGVIECRGGRWRHRQGLRQLLASLSRDKLGNPTRDLAAEVERVKSMAATAAPEAEVPVDGWVVFTSPIAELKLEDCGDRVTTPNDLRTRMRDANGVRRISDATRRQLEEALDALSGGGSAQEVADTPKRGETRSRPIRKRRPPRM